MAFATNMIKQNTIRVIDQSISLLAQSKDGIPQGTSRRLKVDTVGRNGRQTGNYGSPRSDKVGTPIRQRGYGSRTPVGRSSREYVLDKSTEPRKIHSSHERRYHGVKNNFQQDVLATLSAQLLASQNQCLILEKENNRLDQLISASTKLVYPKQNPTPGQLAVEQAFTALENEVDAHRRRSNHEKNISLSNRKDLKKLVQAHEKDSSEKEKLRAFVRAVSDENATLKTMLDGQKNRHTKQINDLRQAISDRKMTAIEGAASEWESQITALQEEIKQANNRNEMLQRQYTKLYTFCYGSSQVEE